jgi:hypothetical protein
MLDASRAVAERVLAHAEAIEQRRYRFVIGVPYG